MISSRKERMHYNEEERKLLGTSFGVLIFLADMVELADTVDLKSTDLLVRVRVPLSAPFIFRKENTLYNET